MPKKPLTDIEARNKLNQLGLKFDFYLSDHKILIEYDGKHHFKPVEYFGGEQTLKRMRINDEVKNNYVRNSGFNLIRISYRHKNDISTILNDYLLDNEKDKVVIYH